MICDRDVLGTWGMSQKAPRITVRAVLKNKNNEYAVMYSDEFKLYSLPGGGVEKGESLIDAIKREVWEETGCIINSIEELGYVEENRAHCDYTQINYYFVLETNDEILCSHLTNNEIKHGITALWLSFFEMYKRISSPLHDTNQKKFLQARDVVALDEYIKQKNLNA